MEQSNNFHNVLMVKKPIFNEQLNVVAQELIYQLSQSPQDGSTQQQIIDSLLDGFTEPDFQGVIGSKLTLMKLSQQALRNHMLPPKEQFAIDVSLDALEQGDMEKIKDYVQQGHKLTLSSQEYQESHRPLYELAEIIKINCKGLQRDSLQQYSEQLQQFKAKTLVDNVDDYQDYELCQELEFDYYSGYFLSKPRLRKDSKVSSNRLVVMKLLSKLQDKDITTDEIIDLLSQDARLVYKLVRIVNSASYALPRKISSLREVVVMLGLQQLKSWASLLALANIEHKPHELMMCTMIRAKMCELLAEELQLESADSYFTLGMFSTLDALLDMNMEDILQELPLDDELKAALLQRGGQGGHLLTNVIAYEQGLWNTLDLESLDNECIMQNYFDSVNWATKAASELYD